MACPPERSALVTSRTTPVRSSGRSARRSRPDSMLAMSVRLSRSASAAVDSASSAATYWARCDSGSGRTRTLAVERIPQLLRDDGVVLGSLGRRLLQLDGRTRLAQEERTAYRERAEDRDEGQVLADSLGGRGPIDEG